jgi:DinB superfamily
MNLDYFIERFAKNKAVFEALARGLSNEQVRWRPAPDKWSILEVINHLYDEEREDFRQRIALVLADPRQSWPSIDPRGWVITRAYNERDLDQSLDNFLAERDRSLVWLRQLSSPNWDNKNQGPNGTLAAGDLLAAWLAHDFLHTRQLARLHWQYTGVVAAPYQTTYGGPWRET